MDCQTLSRTVVRQWHFDTEMLFHSPILSITDLERLMTWVYTELFLQILSPILLLFCNSQSYTSRLISWHNQYLKTVVKQPLLITALFLGDSTQWLRSKLLTMLHVLLAKFLIMSCVFYNFSFAALIKNGSLILFMQWQNNYFNVFGGHLTCIN